LVELISKACHLPTDATRGIGFTAFQIALSLVSPALPIIARALKKDPAYSPFGSTLNDTAIVCLCYFFSANFISLSCIFLNASCQDLKVRMMRSKVMTALLPNAGPTLTPQWTFGGLVPEGLLLPRGRASCGLGNTCLHSCMPMPTRMFRCQRRT